MALPRAPDDTVRVAVTGTYAGSNWASIFHCLLTKSATVLQADLDAWTTSFASAFSARFTTLQATGITQKEIKSVLMVSGGFELVSDLAITHTSSAGAGLDALNCADLVSWATPVYWRGGKPRTYLPAVLATSTTDGKTYTSAHQTALAATAGAFIVDINALTHGTITGTQFGFVSFHSGNVVRTPPVFFPISGAKVHSRIATQRRRLGKWQS